MANRLHQGQPAPQVCSQSPEPAAEQAPEQIAEHGSMPGVDGAERKKRFKVQNAKLQNNRLTLHGAAASAFSSSSAVVQSTRSSASSSAASDSDDELMFVVEATFKIDRKTGRITNFIKVQD